MRLAAACLATLVLAACGGTRNGEARVVTRAVEVQLAVARDATIPSGVMLKGSSGPTRERQSVAASWSFGLSTGWPAYKQRAEAALLAAGYQRTTAPGDASAFSRHEWGDVYKVLVAHDASAPGTRATVTFRAESD